MDTTNPPPPAKPFRVGSDEARSTRARTWNIILFHIQDTFPVQAPAPTSTPFCANKIAKRGVLYDTRIKQPLYGS